MLLDELPCDVLNKIIFHTNIHTQKTLTCVSKIFHILLQQKLEIYKLELQNIILYIKHISQYSIVTNYIIFRIPNIRVKISLTNILKFNLSYKKQNSKIVEKIQINHYFLYIDQLIDFIVECVQHCDLYNNVLLFSQKYHYYKIY